METRHSVRSIARVVVSYTLSQIAARRVTDIRQLLMIFNLILDLCFLAAVPAKASQEAKPSYYAVLLMGVSSLRTLATITPPLFPPHRNNLATPQQECDSIKPIPDCTMTLKSSGTSWPRSPVIQHTPPPGDCCTFEQATRLVRGEDEEVSDVGLANLIRMREKQAYQLRGLAPLERFIVARDNIPVGLDDQD